MAFDKRGFATACTLAFYYDRVRNLPANVNITSQEATKQATGVHICEYNHEKWYYLLEFHHHNIKMERLSQAAHNLVSAALIFP